MKHKKLLQICIAVLAFGAILCTGVAAQDLIGNIAPAAAGNLPEYTDGYENEWFDGSSHGWAERGYQTGGLFNWFRARAYTGVNGDPNLDANVNSALAYAFIENKNENTSKSNTTTDMDPVTRYCGAYTDRISDSYATYLEHRGRLYVSGGFEFDKTVRSPF